MTECTLKLWSQCRAMTECTLKLRSQCRAMTACTQTLVSVPSDDWVHSQAPVSVPRRSTEHCFVDCQDSWCPSIQFTQGSVLHRTSHFNAIICRLVLIKSGSAEKQIQNSSFPRKADKRVMSRWRKRSQAKSVWPGDRSNRRFWRFDLRYFHVAENTPIRVLICSAQTGSTITSAFC